MKESAAANSSHSFICTSPPPHLQPSRSWAEERSWVSTPVREVEADAPRVFLAESVKPFKYSIFELLLYIWQCPPLSSQLHCLKD